MFFRLAWRNIWRNKRRSIITVMMVFLAVVLAVIMRSIQLGAYQNMIDNVVSFYSGYAQIHKQGYWEEKTLDEAFVPTDTLRNILNAEEEINHWSPRLESFALASAGELTRGTLVAGIDPEQEKYITQLDKKLISGTYLSAENNAMIGAGLAEKLHLTTGDTIILFGQGYHGVLAAGKYPICGIVQFGTPELNDGVVYLQVATAGELYGMGDQITGIVLSVKHSDKAIKTVEALRAHIPSDQYEVMDWKEMMPDLVQLIEADSSGGVIFISILYMIIAFGIFGTLLMMLAERTHEFGTLVAIGMHKWKLAIVVVLELFMIAGAGVLLGGMASIPVVQYFIYHPIQLSGEMADAYRNFGLEPVFPFSGDPVIYLSQGLVVFIMCLVLSIYPFVRIVRLKTMEAMRNN